MCTFSTRSYFFPFFIFVYTSVLQLILNFFFFFCDATCVQIADTVQDKLRRFDSVIAREKEKEIFSPDFCVGLVCGKKRGWFIPRAQCARSRIYICHVCSFNICSTKCILYMFIECKN